MQQQLHTEDQPTQAVTSAVIREEQSLTEATQTGAITPLTEEEEARLEAQDWLIAIGQPRPPRVDPLVFWIFATTVLPWVIQRLEYPYFGSLWWYLLFFSLPLGVVTPLTITSRLNRQKQEAREDQEAADADVRWIGVLAQALHAPNARQRSAAARLLRRLLPRLKTAQAGLLNAQAQYNLCVNLRANKSADMELNLAILKALERFGSGDATLAAIEYVADATYWLPNQRFVQKAAKTCLNRLESRLTGNKTPGAAEEWDETAVSKKRGGERKSSPEIEALKRRLREESKGQTAPAMRSPFLIAAWATILPGCLWKIVDSLQEHDWLTALAFGAIAGVTIQLPRLVLSSKQTDAAQKLATYDNVEGIGPLAEALEWPDPAIREMAAKSLIRLLPQLNASDAGLLSVPARGCLYRCLRMGNARHEEKLLTAILKALEQVGDEAALPYVRRLAGGNAITRSQQRVQQKAIACLPFLESGASQRRGSDVLLRASSMDSAQPEILLRPATATVTESDQLLRAGIEGERS